MPWLSEIRSIFERFQGLEEEREFSRSLVRHWIVARVHLDRMLGDVATGLVVLEAFYSNNPEVTAAYVSQRLGGTISDDTAGRDLRKMQKMGVVTCRKQGRALLYRMTPDIAEAALSIMTGKAEYPSRSV